MKQYCYRCFVCTSFLILHLIVLQAISFAFHYWPDTGQEKCYGDGQSPIPCPGSGPYYGQDAQYDGLPRIYTKLDCNGNDLPTDAVAWAMVRDELTGLIWEVKTYANKDLLYTWNQATAYVETMNNADFCGHHDWRLPTIKELSSIVHAGRNTPAVTAIFFPNTIGDDVLDSSVISRYWSGTEDAADPANAWYVRFKLGNVYNSEDENGNKDRQFHVRAVRGGRADFAGTRFVDNGTTITDRATGLVWQKSYAAELMDWEAALNYCEDLVLDSQDDWRLPNRNELQSLLDYSRHTFAVDAGFTGDFPAYNGVGIYFWSSTANDRDPPAGENRHAWYVDFVHGQVFSSDYGDTYYVRAVRGKQSGPAVNMSITVKGKGRVTSQAMASACEDNCAGTFHYGDTLTAVPDRDFVFTGWDGGGCRGNGNTCTIIANQSDVTAIFKRVFSWPSFIPAVTGAGRHK